MSKGWYIQHKGKIVGPVVSAQLKQLAASGKINQETMVRLGEDGEWTRASKVQGLFTQVAAVKPQPVAAGLPAELPRAQQEIVEYRPCPICGENITQSAIKCRHCNEFLDGRPSPAIAAQPAMAFASMPAAAPAPVVNVTQVNHVVGYPQQRFNPLVAAILSFFIPGLGQLYKGQPVNGFIWFLAVFFTYAISFFLFFIPGMILHLLCVLGAASGSRR